MTLSPCRTLQNVVQTQRCVPCSTCARPNRCVFKCSAKISKLKEEDLKPTGKTFQLLGPATAKDLNPPVSPMTRNNNVTMSSRSQSRSTRHQRSTSAIVSKISRGRTTQALKHNHTKFVCNALWVWKPMHIRSHIRVFEKAIIFVISDDLQGSKFKVEALKSLKSNISETV